MSSDIRTITLLALTGFAISSAAIPLILKYLRKPERQQLHHTHKAPISRFGGLSLAVAFLVIGLTSLVAFAPANRAEDQTFERIMILASSLLMFTLGFWDDWRPLGARRKLIGQIIIASGVFIAGLQSDMHLSITVLRNPFTKSDLALGWLSYPVTVLWLVAFTNLVNLIDGIDGLAGGVGLIVMALLLYVGHTAASSFTVICAAGMCGALLGFLRYNFPPARIYLGDGGAYFLGFLLGVLSMAQSHKGTVAAALIAPLFALALPIVDVSLAIVRRGLKGVPIFRPDQRHLHHRLTAAGLSRTRVVLMFYGGSLFFLLLAFGAFVSEGRWVPILFGVMCVFLILAARSFSFSREWFAVGKVLGNSLEVRKNNRYALALGKWLELEAERASSAEGLWEDFCFMTKKLGFSTATLVTEQTRRTWMNSLHHRSIGPLHRRKFELRATLTLEFTAPGEKLTPTTFEFLSELSAETWVRSLEIWNKVNRAPYEFDGHPQETTESVIGAREITPPSLPPTRLSPTDPLREHLTA